MDTNLKLYLPFDDPDGSLAADFSTGRHDATLTGGAALSRDAMIGKALDLRGGDAWSHVDLPLTSNFSVSMYIRTEGRKIGWVLNFSGLNNYKEQWLDVDPDTWYFLAFVRDGANFKVYLGKQVVFADGISGNPTGLSVNDESINESNAMLDEVRVFNRALAPVEILQLQAATDVEYFVNGHNFKEFGVYVSDSKGIVGQLEKKDGLTVDWDDYHGKVRDKTRPRFKERTIQLECFIEGVSRGEFYDKLSAFLAQFDGSGSQRLKVEFDGTAKPLVYEVYQKKAADVTKQWSQHNRALMVGTFKLELEEDEPVKRVLRFIAQDGSMQASVGFTSSKLLNIYWGDGNMTSNLSGTSQTATHTYTAPGEYDIIITGVIEDISNFTHNAILVWNKLK